MAGWVRAYAIRGRDRGFRRRRGNADVKYQCPGFVPHAEAPRLESEGKTFERKAESSGHRGVGDCQKNVSIGIESARPMRAPKTPAGRKALLIIAIGASRPFLAALPIRYKP